MKLAVYVKTNQRDDRFLRSGDSYVAHIKAVPKDGEANDYLEVYIAEVLQVPRSLVTVKRGFQSRHKLIEVDYEMAMVTHRLARLEHV